MELPGGQSLAIPIPVTQGGTGTITQFTPGSVIFAGVSGVYTQDNANFFFDNATDELGVGTNNPIRAFHVTAQVGNTNTVQTNLRVESTSSGTAAAGFGVAIEFAAESAGGQIAIAGIIGVAYTTATDTAETANFIFTLIVAGTAIEVLRIRENGRQGVNIALTDGANIAVNAALFTPGSIGRVTLAGNRTFDNPTNPVDGQWMSWELFSTSSRTLTFGSKYKGSADLALPAATTGGSKTDMLLWRYNLAADQWWLVAKNFGFAA